MTCFSKRLRLLTFALGLLALTAIFDNLTGYNGSLPGRSVFKSASGEARAAMVQAVATFGKAYVQSDLFKGRYAAYLEANRPTLPTPESVEGEVARQKKEM